VWRDVRWGPTRCAEGLELLWGAPLGFLGAQKDNVENQREHLVLLITNQRMACPDEQVRRSGALTLAASQGCPL